MGITCTNCIRKNNNRKVQQQNKNMNDEENCYKCETEIIQRPEIGRDDYIIKINAQHKAEHSCDEQILLITFNYPVNFINCSNGKLISSNNTTRIRVKLTYHNNPNDKIEIGDFNVKCSHLDLEIVNCTFKDNKKSD